MRDGCRSAVEMPGMIATGIVAGAGMVTGDDRTTAAEQAPGVAGVRPWSSGIPRCGRDLMSHGTTWTGSISGVPIQRNGTTGMAHAFIGRMVR
jgi:hypothetical protein